MHVYVCVQEDVTAVANDSLMSLVFSTTQDFDLGPVVNVRCALRAVGGYACMRAMWGVWLSGS